MSEKNLESSKINTLEDVLEHAQEKGIILPKKQIEFMKKGLEEEKITAPYLATIIDQIAEKKEEIGLKWNDKDISKEDPEKQGKVISTFIDNNKKVHAYIQEMTVKNSENPEKIGSKFYVAKRIDPSNEQGKEDNHVQMCTSSNIDGAKNNVSAYFTSIILSEIKSSKEVDNKQKESIGKDTPGIDM